MTIKYARTFILFLLFIQIFTIFTTVEIQLPQNTTANSKTKLVQEFERLDLALNNGQGYSNYFNENGSLAWGESYLLEAYLDMYTATDSIYYLEKFVSHANNVIANTDQARELKDYRGRSVIGWSATKYSANNMRVIYLVHTGMITYPLVKFAKIIKSDPYLYEQFEQVANTYLTTTKEALSVFDPDWNFDYNTDEGFYQINAIEITQSRMPLTNFQGVRWPVHFNQQLAAGRSLVILCQLEGNASFSCQQAKGLANHFKNRLIQQDNGSYIWHMWYGVGLDLSTYLIEDISHGSISLDFAILAYRSGIVFEQEDIKRFIKTYQENVFNNEQVAANVDGSLTTIYGKSGELFKDSIGRWLELAKYDCQVWHDFNFLLTTNQLSQHPSVMLGIAKAIKYEDYCGLN